MGQQEAGGEQLPFLGFVLRPSGVVTVFKPLCSPQPVATLLGDGLFQVLISVEQTH